MALGIRQFKSESGPASNNFAERTLTFDAATISGNRVVVLVELYTSTGEDATAGMITDSGGHTWVQDKGLDGDGSTGGVAALSVGSTAAINTVTLDPGGSGNYGLWAIVEFDGPAELDDAESGSGNSTSPAPASMTATTTDGIALSIISTRHQSGNQTVPSGWTAIEIEPDNSTNLAGAIAYSPNISSAGAVTANWTITSGNPWYAIGVLYKASAPAFAEVSRIMGGTDDRGWFGNDDLGGADNSVTTTFSPAIPAGYGLIIYLSLYNYTPSDTSLLSLAGAGNTLIKTSGAFTAHNAAGSNDGSNTFFHCVLASDCSSCTFDATALAGGDTGRYGQIVFFVVQSPNTSVGFYTATAVTNTQTSTTTINPGTLTLPTTDSLELFGWTNRGHTEDLLPLSISPAVFPTELQHTELHVVTSSPTEFGSVHNSITQSGSVMGYRNTSGGTHTPVVTFTGTSPATGSAHSVLTAWNIAGGTVVSGAPINLRLGLLGIY